jgi:hypothetical protein
VPSSAAAERRWLKAATQVGRGVQVFDGRLGVGSRERDAMRLLGHSRASFGSALANFEVLALTLPSFRNIGAGVRGKL